MSCAIDSIPEGWGEGAWSAACPHRTIIDGARILRCAKSMSAPLPILYLARHGETAWSLSGQHTGLTDLPLTPRGEQNALQLGLRLRGLSFARVLTSPLQRAARTCALAGFGDVAHPDPDLVEWNYGEYEGKKTAEILVQRPGWELFRDGCPGGEKAADVGARADRVIARIRAVDGNVLVFSSAHILRVLTARWLALPPAGGRLFLLGTASLSMLGYEHDAAEPVIRMWNDTTPV
jgi:probable phosphoglycerate mutase